MSGSAVPRPSKPGDESDPQRLVAIARALVESGRSHTLAPTDAGDLPWHDPGAAIGSADRAIAALWLDWLRKFRPGDGVLCEDWPERPSQSGLRWVLDPIDGTVNRLRGIPVHCLSAACERLNDGNWRAVAGAVLDPVHDALYFAISGTGAWCGDRRLAIGHARQIECAAIAVELQMDRTVREAEMAALAGILQAAGVVRATGSSALDLCWLASARIDGFVDLSISRWDWAAGALIVEEAGGTCIQVEGGMIAGTPAIARRMMELLPSAMAARGR